MGPYSSPITGRTAPWACLLFGAELAFSHCEARFLRRSDPQGRLQNRDRSSRHRWELLRRVGRSTHPPRHDRPQTCPQR